MATRRGLNMGRGLESLFPQKAQPAKDRVPEETAPSGAKASEAESAESERGATSETPASDPERGKPGVRAIGGNVMSNQRTDANPSSEPEAAAAASATTPVGTASESQTDIPADGVFTLKISEVSPNVAQPRKAFDEEAIAELAASIREFGVLQPLLVQKKGDFYEIVAGERRWRAAKKAGLKEIPALVREYTDRQTFEISLIENLQRENLNPIEESMAYQRLIEEFALTQEAVAKRVAKSRTAVTNALRLLKLDPEVQQMLVSGELSPGHARALLPLEGAEKQLLAARQVAAAQMSVRDTEKLVKRMQTPTATRQRAVDPQIEAVYQSIEESLRKKTGTKVSIHRGRGQVGRIEIEYYSQEDLERILSMIG